MSSISWFRRIRLRYKNRPGVIPWLFAFPQRSLFWVLSFLPESVLYRVADALGRLVIHSNRRRELGQLHLERAMPELTSAEHLDILRRSCGHLGRAAVEAMVLWPRRNLQKMNARVEFSDGCLELLERFKGIGVLFVQSHLGAIEMTSTVLDNLGFEPATVMRRPSNWYLAEDLLKARNRIQGDVLEREGALRRLLKGLKSNRSVVLTADQNARVNPLMVPWFGHEAATERTPAALALKTGVPVIVVWCMRQPGPQPFLFGCSLVHEGEKGAVNDDNLLAVTSRFHAHLEEVIRSRPEQYLWIHNRYHAR